MALMMSALCRMNGASAPELDRSEKPCGLLQAAACIQQNLFAGKFNVHAKISRGFHGIDHHVSIVMDIDNYVLNAKFTQAGKRDFQHGASGNLYQRLGAIVGERAQARAQSGGQDHGFHLGAFSSCVF